VATVLSPVSDCLQRFSLVLLKRMESRKPAAPLKPCCQRKKAAAVSINADPVLIQEQMANQIRQPSPTRSVESPRPKKQRGRRIRKLLIVPLALVGIGSGGGGGRASAAWISNTSLIPSSSSPSTSNSDNNLSLGGSSNKTNDTLPPAPPPPALPTATTSLAGRTVNSSPPVPDPNPDNPTPIPLVVTNNCAEMIWPGIGTQNGIGPGTGGFELGPGQSRNMWVSPDWQGRVWGRTNCSFNEDGTGPSNLNGVNGNGAACLTGDCFARLDCEFTVSFFFSTQLRPSALLSNAILLH